MSSINFQSGTIIPSSWLNDVNTAVYTTVPGLVAQSSESTVANLPSAATLGLGARRFVVDANATTFASVVAGGGANTVPVYSDGANWRIG